MRKRFLFPLLGSMVTLMALPSLTNIKATKLSFNVAEARTLASNNKTNTSNELVEDVLWENDGTHGDPNWDASIYTFGLYHPFINDYLESFPINKWNKLKYNTFYIDIEIPQEASYTSFAICNLESDSSWTTWSAGFIDTGSELMTENDDGSYTVTVSFKGDVVIKNDNFAVYGAGFIPTKIYFNDDPHYVNIWQNDGSTGDPSYDTPMYRFGIDSRNDPNPYREIFPEMMFRKLRNRTFYLDFEYNESAGWIDIQISTGWWDHTWDHLNLESDCVTENDDGTYTAEICFEGHEIVDYLDEQDLLFTGMGYIPLNLHYNLSDYTVSFDTNGHGEIPAITLVEDSLIEKPADPVDPNGLEFCGWYTDPQFKNPWYFGEDTVSGDMTLYAKFDENKVASIEVLSFPYCVHDFGDHEGGSLFKYDNANLKVTYSSGDDEVIPIDKKMVSRFKPSIAKKQNAVIRYEGCYAPVNLYVLMALQDFKLITPPTKTEYKCGEELDLTGGVISFIDNDNEMSYELGIDPYLTTYNKYQVGEQTVEISYGPDFKASFTVNLTDFYEGLAVRYETVKRIYEYGEDLELDGFLAKKMASGICEDIPMKDLVIDGYDKYKIGAQRISVSYEGTEVNLDVTVKDILENITMKSLPAKPVIIQGQALDVTDGMITTSYISGNEEDVEIIDSMISGFDPATLGKQTVTVTYVDKTTTFDVNVVESIENVSLKSNPTKLTYKYGENLDLTGAQLTIESSGTNYDVNVTPSLVSGFDNTKLGSQTLTITYGDKTTEFNVSVEDYASGIAIKSLPTKTEYKLGEELDLTGAKITVTMISGAANDVDITASMVSGYDKNVEGTQTLTVTYEDKTTTFDVTVEDCIASIVIKSNPTKVQYIVGEELNLAGAKITVTYASGISEEIEVTPSLVSGYDKNKVGEQTITVTYEDKTATFVVTVTEPTPTPTPTQGGLSTGAVVGIAIGCAVVGAGLTLLITFLLKKKKFN